MKKIVTVAKRIIRYQCEVCKTPYKTPAQAKRCEARPVEEKKFRVGQTVCSVQPRYCTNRKPYDAKGEVVKIWRPQSPEHARQYEISFICPHCGKRKGALYYAHELKAA